MHKEWIGGLTTFITMAYIVVVNPAILSTEGSGIPFSGAMAATVSLCFLMTLFMGLFANLPFGVAPGMGLNAFFTFTVILAGRVPWTEALGMVFWAGVLFLLVSLTNIREGIALSIPPGIRHGAAAGIGLFLCFIGFKSMGLIQGDAITFVKAGSLKLETFLGLAGLAVGAYLVRLKQPIAYLATIGAVTTLAALFGRLTPPGSFFSLPDFSATTFKLDLMGALKPQYLGIILTIAFTDLFDSISTFVGVSEATQLIQPHEKKQKFRRGLIVDAFATFSAALLGTSPGTAYIESAAGIQAGARSGKASIVTALCFLPCFFLGPIVGMIPAYATAPVLILVGMTMFATITNLKAISIEEILPGFLTMILIPLTFSITQGILWGFVFHVILFTAARRHKEISPVVWGVAALCVLLLAIEARHI